MENLLPPHPPISLLVVVMGTGGIGNNTGDGEVMGELGVRKVKNEVKEGVIKPPLKP